MIIAKLMYIMIVLCDMDILCLSFIENMPYK